MKFSLSEPAATAARAGGETCVSEGEDRVCERVRGGKSSGSEVSAKAYV